MTRIKNINTRIQLKNDTETNWNKAKAEEGKDGFIPLLGEAIVYMGDNNHGPRLKIGDGITNVTDLPFLEDKDTVYTASNGIKITAENIIQHINYLDAFPSEIGFYKIKYDQNGHINGATAVSKQDIINLLEITPGRIDSVQITAEAPLVSSNSTENTTSLVTNISFNAQEKNTVLAGPSNAASGSPSFRLLVEDDIPNLSASKITGTFSADQIGNLPASKINSGTFHEDRIPNLGPSKISGVIPVSKGGTGVNGINGDPEHNINSFINNGVFAYDSGNARFKQFGITAPGNTDTFTSYVNSLEGETTNLLVDLRTLIKAIPPMNLNNPRDITGNYIDSYYAPKTKGWKNSVLISQGEENWSDGVEPIWLNPNSLSAEGSHGGALFYGRYSREVERIVDNETVISTETGFETQWGTLPVEQGGTGVTNFNNNYVLIGSGENPIRTIQKTSSLISNTIVERDTNGDFATRSITLSQNLLCNNINENFKDNKIISIDSSNKLATFFGNVNANNLTAFIGELKMSKTNSETIDQPSIKWYKGNSIKTESAITSQTNTLIGELYWDHNNSNRGMLRNYYLANNAETYSDSYYLPETNTSSASNNIFTLLATEDSISNMFPSNSILYSNGKVNKITYKNSADGALYSTSTNGNLEWGTLPVAQGGTGLTTSGTVNAVIIGNSVENYKTRAFQTVSTNSGAFYATGVNSKPEFGTLPIGQGGTGVTSIADIQAGKDGDGNTISSTYLKLSGGTMTGTLTINSDIIQTSGNLKGQSDDNYTNHALKLGHSSDNVMQFFEYGGVFEFIKSVDGTNTTLFQICDGASNYPLPVNNGGTGATTATAARTNLGITPANIGAVSKHGDTMDGTLTFEDSEEGLFCEIDYKNIWFYKYASSTSGWVPTIQLQDAKQSKEVQISSADGIEIYGPVPGASAYKVAYLNGDGLYTRGTLLVDDVATIHANIVTTGYILRQDNSTNHALKLGYDSDGKMQFFEYGGQFEFYQSQSGTNTLLFQVKNGASSAPLPVNNGGTGATTAAGARTNLDVPSTTGSGASGTWGINISGNAATATSSGSCTGNAATATKATQDGSGNTITSTYAKIGAHNNLVASGNEFTFASSGQSGAVWFNYRTAGGANGDITEYVFGDGKNGCLASITANTFKGNCAGSAGSVAWGNITSKPTSYKLMSTYVSSNPTSTGSDVVYVSGTTNIPAGNYYIVASCYVHQNTGSGSVKLKWNNKVITANTISNGAVMSGSNGTFVMLTGFVNSTAGAKTVSIVLNSDSSSYTMKGMAYMAINIDAIAVPNV